MTISLASLFTLLVVLGFIFMFLSTFSWPKFPYWGRLAWGCWMVASLLWAFGRRSLAVLVAGLLVGLMWGSSALAVPVSFATTTVVQVAAPFAGRSTHVMAFDLVAAGATTVQFEYGTKVTTNCDTGAVVLTGLMTLSTGVPNQQGDGTNTLFIAPPGTQLCLVQSGSVQVSGFVSLRQQ